MVEISVSHKDADGNLFHTYSCYSRGVEMLNGAYHYLAWSPRDATKLARAIFSSGCAAMTNIKINSFKGCEDNNNISPTTD
jgi:hypothetical protein